MVTLFTLLFIVCFSAFIIGLIRPTAVIRWGSKEKRTRKSVLKYYGLGFLLFAVLTGIFAPDSDSNFNGSSDKASAAVEEPATVDKSPAADLDSQIDTLGDPDSITLDDAAAVQEIRKAYDALEPGQKSQVAKLWILEEDESRLAEQKAEADQKAAAAAQAIADQKAAEAQAQADKEAQAAAAAETQEKAELQTTQDQNNYTVYVTKTGDKYHRDGCRYLRQSKIAISKSEAQSEGYTPCSICNP